MNDVQANEPYVHRNKKKSLKLAQDAFKNALDEEINRSLFSYYQHRCDLEREAKAAAGASHRVSMPCTYWWCQ